MWRLANGRATEGVGTRTITPAGGLIAKLIWKGALPNEVRHKVQWALPDTRPDTRGTMDSFEDDQTGNVDAEIQTDLWGGQENHADDEQKEAID